MRAAPFQSLIGSLLALFCLPAWAGQLSARVESRGGGPLADAVVYATPVDGRTAPPPTAAPAVVDQIDKEYVPYVTPIQAGTRVLFPNHDQIRHHVYSFSDAKTFEIPLYKGTPADPVRFDAPGEVVLGCNIHDWMRAYLLVLETPYYAVTDSNGAATLDLPPGAYRVEVWHPELAATAESTAERVELAPGGVRELRFSIERRRVWRPRRAPARDEAGYP